MISKFSFVLWEKNDIFIQKFREEDELLDKKGISCIRHMYEGEHDWNVWRYCIRDFAQMLLLSNCIVVRACLKNHLVNLKKKNDVFLQLLNYIYASVHNS